MLYDFSQYWRKNTSQINWKYFSKTFIALKLAHNPLRILFFRPRLPIPAASAPKISLPTAEPKAAAKPSVALPRANTARPAFKPASAKPVQPVKMADDSPSAVSVAVDFVAAAVAVAFAVMILLDV